MTQCNRGLLLGALAAVLIAEACATSEDPILPPGSSNAAAGDTGNEVGGANSQGGTSAEQGGAVNTGGTSGVLGGAAPTGGVAATGGAIPSTGGAVATGGAAPVTGGASPTGGRAPTGGAAPATGGVAPATGGAAPATGGSAPATGGSAPATGGAATATGGAATATGGTATAAGGTATATGGAGPATGGAATGSGPCSGLCDNPTSYATKPSNSMMLSSSGTCYEIMFSIAGLVCGPSPTTFSSFSINGIDLMANCTNAWISPLPTSVTAVNGGYCVQGVSASGTGWVNF